MLFKTHRKNVSTHSEIFFSRGGFYNIFSARLIQQTLSSEAASSSPVFPPFYSVSHRRKTGWAWGNMCAAAFIIRTIPIVPTDYIVRLCYNTLCVLSALTNSLVFLHSVATFYIYRFFQPEKRKNQPASDVLRRLILKHFTWICSSRSPSTFVFRRDTCALLGVTSKADTNFTW